MFCKDLQLPGCSHGLHMPCLDFMQLPVAGSVVDVAVLFRPKEGHVALYLVGPPGTLLLYICIEISYIYIEILLF